MARRILIVDDHPVVRAGLIELLRSDEGLFVVGEAATRQEVEDILQRTTVDIALVDVSLHDDPRGGLEVARRLAQLQPPIRILAFSSHTDDAIQQEMLRIGVERYLVKGGPPEDILSALRTP